MEIETTPELVSNVYSKLKENIEKVGETESGVPVSDFDYKKDKDAPEGPGRYRGVIAQDLVGTEHEDAVKKINKNTKTALQCLQKIEYMFVVISFSFKTE